MMDLRKAAIQELKRHNINYILVPGNEFAGPDFRNNTALWGIHLLAEAGTSRLYEVD